MWLGGFLTAIGFVAIAAKINPGFLKKVLGYDWVVDLVCTVGIICMFGTTGTISGMMIGITTGLAISAVLYVTRKFWGYEKLEKVDGKLKWVEHNGEWTIESVVKSIHSMITAVPAKINQIRDAWNEEENTTLKAVA